MEAPAYDPDENRRINVRNLNCISEYSIRLADVVETVLEDGDFPLLLGGDCSILLGPALALRRSKRAGLVYIDGHTDFFLPEHSRSGAAAGMDLALVTGWGPSTLTNIEGFERYWAAQDVAVLGNRDPEEAPTTRDFPSMRDAGFHYRSLADMRAVGIEAAAGAAIDALAGASEGYWIHFDVDVIDSNLMPAVDSPQEDGLSWAESEALLRALLQNNAVGMQVTVYDPERDAGLSAGRSLVAMLKASVGSMF